MRVFEAIGIALTMAAGLAQPQTLAAPKFEVASLRRCDSPPLRGMNMLEGSTPQRLHMRCVTLANLIQEAYIMFANGRVNSPPPVPIEGGPAWVTSDRYEIDAKAEQLATLEMMRGPMLQALLEERFKLRVHRDTRGEISIYTLGLAKNGFKLHELEEGARVAFDVTKPAEAPAPARQPPPACDDVRLARNLEGSGANLTLIATGLTLDTFSRWITPFAGLDRPVVNTTAIPGRFSFHLDFTPEDGPLAFRPGGDLPADPAGPSIFTAIQEQLGLKLEPAKSPAEFLVIDHVERPSGN